MTKKEYLIKIFSALELSREPAKGLKVLIEHQKIDEHLLDVLLEAVKSAVNTTSDILQKQKLQKMVNYLQEIKEMEKESRELDQEDINKLETIIENL